MKQTAILTAALAAIITGHAAVVEVTQLDYAGPFAMPAPAMIDSVNVNAGKYDVKSLLDKNINADAALKNSRVLTDGIIPAAAGTPAMGILSFDFTNQSYVSPEVKIEGLTDYRLFIDGKAAGGKTDLRPGSHRAIIRFIHNPDKADTVSISIDAENAERIELGTKSKLYTLDDAMHGRRIASTSVSPDGKYLITYYYTNMPDGSAGREWVITTVAGAPVARSPQRVAWMPKGSRYYTTVSTPEGYSIMTTDAASGKTTTFASGIPFSDFTIAPNEEYLIRSEVERGPKEDPDVYRIIEPEDRQAGWRDRNALYVYDLATGISRPVTFGHKSVGMLDVSNDGSKLLLMTSHSRLEKRPTTVFTIASLDLNTMVLDTIVADDGFLNSAIFSPDASKIVIAGSPECLGGIGKNVPEGRTPSMIDMQLYLYDVATREFMPLTRDFNPNVQDFKWSAADGKIYLNAEDRDCMSLFSIDPADGKIEKIPVPQDVVRSFSLPDNGNTIGIVTQSVRNPDRLYTYDRRSRRFNMLDEPLAERLSKTQLGEVESWNFVNSNGDSICGTFYLPPNFDPAKKYPMIVYYYGGCSPTTRYFESHYPNHAFAAQGYVVYVIEPSGATGFGQEFSSRHVNTAGTDPSRDIIEGTKKFCEEHPFVDSTKIGCIGASYGGFMTQYLQTVTDIFAAAISHAGISDHTSYWGEGYWGYSYSEVSMANSYPWSDTDLFVKHSPLYNADKIHTPLLFLHGDADTNVPFGESIQMFTALKLLGRPTAFVAVKDQDHHILDHDKRIKWQDTIFAWFAKYLKDEPEWWNKMYPEHNL